MHRKKTKREKEQFKVGISQERESLLGKAMDSVWVVPADHGVAH